LSKLITLITYILCIDIEDSNNLQEVDKSPGWLRGAQIGLGLIAVILSISIIARPALATLSIVYILSIVLLVIGIGEVLSGIFIKRKSRLASIVLGIIVIILAITLLAFPVGTTVFVIYLLAIALFFVGIERIVHGVGNKERRGWARAFSIGVGVIALAVSIAIMASPVFGAKLLGVIVGIALLIIGIEMMIAGITGKRQSILPTR
jgi:uncharacterized membrane protein HdeD (DUF308 family)